MTWTADRRGDGDEPAGGTAQMLRRHGHTLVRLAAASIRHGLEHGRSLPVDPSGHAAELRAAGASFVTLKAGGSLRGCVGSAQALLPLVADVAANAFAAAFGDDRFPRLTTRELTTDAKETLTLSVSVLSPQQPILFGDEAALLAALRPGVDGLVIQSAGKRALFLPQVWEALPTAESFLGQLKAKAGLPPRHWADDFTAWRFTAESTASQAVADAAAHWSMN